MLLNKRLDIRIHYALRRSGRLLGHLGFLCQLRLDFFLAVFVSGIALVIVCTIVPFVNNLSFMHP